MSGTLALPQPPLLVITDRRQARQPLEELAATVFAAGCRWLMLREKDLDPAARLALTERLTAQAADHGATVTINSDQEAARQAAGLHLPRDGDVAAARRALGPRKLIGQSAHNLAEAERAAAAGADYVTLSPIFASASKPGYGPALGLESLRAVASSLPIPVIALGGVEADKVEDCMAAGAGGIAVMGPVMRAADPAETIRALLHQVQGRSPVKRWLGG